MNIRVVRLIVTGVVFFGWLGWLGYASLNKNRGPVVSQVQAAAATHAVKAEIEPGPDGKPTSRVRIIEVLTGDGLMPGTQVVVANMPEVVGFDGVGSYLLLLTAEPQAPRPVVDGVELPVFAIVGQQRSPGFELGSVGPPRIYHWSNEVQSQARTLFP